MARLLFTWEMGSNLGHLGKLRALMSLAQREGHSLSAALKNLIHADQVLEGFDYRCFQAPHRQPQKPRPTPQSLSYAHTLEDFCFADAGELHLRIKAWREIFDGAQPDLIYCEFSPGALIASRGLGVPTVAVGNGYMIPPDVLQEGVFAPFATTPRKPAVLARLRDNDARFLAVLNEGCQRAGVPRFESLAEIFGQADGRCLTTLPELDHFDWRGPATYIGIQPPFGKASPQWPVAGGHRVFCYVQDFPGLALLLKELTDAGLAVLAYVRDAPPGLREEFRRVPNIRFTAEPVDLAALRGEAHFVAHHAGHSFALQSFMYGLPQLSVPTHQEQLLTALQLDRAGVGVTALHNQESFAAEIGALLNDQRYRERALYYRTRYEDFDWSGSESIILEDMANLLAGGSR